jgi:hypothetical protein
VLRTELFAFALLCTRHSRNLIWGNLTTLPVVPDGRMINEELCENHVEQGLILMYYPSIYMDGLKKITKTSVSAVSVLAYIRTGNLQNTVSKRYVPGRNSLRPTLFNGF